MWRRDDRFTDIVTNEDLGRSGKNESVRSVFRRKVFQFKFLWRGRRFGMREPPSEHLMFERESF